MWPTREIYTAGLLAYGFGMAGGLAGHWSNRRPSWLPRALIGLSLAGALLEFLASLVALFARAEPAWIWSSGVPGIVYSVRLDPLSAYFSLTLALLAAAVSVYSFGYVAGAIPRLKAALFCFLLNL